MTPNTSASSLKKIDRLSRGDRSHKLAKALVGPKNKVIYEKYLENKSGQRILWMEEGQTFLVWYVAKHKSVSRLANLMDNSESRSTRHRTELSELGNIALAILENNGGSSSTPFDERPVVLDPLVNVPLKAYEIPAHDLENVADEMWMHLCTLRRKNERLSRQRGPYFSSDGLDLGTLCVFAIGWNTIDRVRE